MIHLIFLLFDSLKTGNSITLFCFLCSCGLTGFSQVNVEIAYAPVYSGMSENNDLLQRYNFQNPELEKPFDMIRMLHGIQLGIRLKNEVLGIGFGWENVSKSSESYGFSQNDQFFTDQLHYSFTNFAMSLENYWGNFGYGASLGRQKLSIKKSIRGTQTKRSISNQSEYFSRFYFIFVIQKSKSVSFAFRPFVQFPWNGYNLSSLQNELFVDEPASPDISDKPVMIGLSFVFYNGTQ